MAAQAVAWRRDRERRERAREAILGEHADLRQQAAAIAHRNERAEHLRELRARQETIVLRFDDEVAAEFARLTSLLQAAAAEPARDLAQIRQAVPIERAPTVEDVPAPPRPQWSQYAPAPPGLFGRRRYDRAIVAARAELDAALARHDEALASGLAELTRQHEHRAAGLRRAHEAEWDAIAAGVAAGDPDAVGTLAVASLQASARAARPDRGRPHDLRRRRPRARPRDRHSRYRRRPARARMEVHRQPRLDRADSHEARRDRHDLCRARRSTRPRCPGRLLPLHRIGHARRRLRQRTRPDHQSGNRKTGPSVPRHRHHGPGHVQPARPAPSETRPESMPARARRRALAPST